MNPFDAMDEPTPEEAQAMMEEIKGSMTGVAVDGTHLAMIAEFADMAVQAAMAELCEMAARLGVDSVPVPVLVQYAQHQSVASQVLWQITELTGAEVKLADVVIPDDLSELDGE